MDPQPPDRLCVTRDLLQRSLLTHAHDPAPPMPASLAQDLMAHFASVPAAGKEAHGSVGWLTKLRNFLAAPGFGLAAAAVVVLGVTVPMLTAPDFTTPDGIRGAAAGLRPDSVKIAFIGENARIEAAVRSSGNFDPLAFVSEAESLPGPKVVIDFAAGTITSIDATGATLHQAKLPDRAADVPDLLLDAVSHF